MNNNRTNRKHRRRWPWIVLGVVIIASAAIGPRVFNAFSLLNSGEQIDIGGREIFVKCQGSGSPTVILEHGLGSNGTEWADVQAAIAEDTRVCYTSRAGMGFSDPVASTTTRTAQDAVDDLTLALNNADIAPPYVMVGHSFGGFVIRLFADQHPADIAAMVLVDSSHPEQTARMQEEMSEEGWRSVGEFFGSTNPERMDFVASAAAVANTNDLGSTPLVVLQAELQEASTAGTNISDAAAAELESVMTNLWPELQLDLAGLSTASTHKVVLGSTHFIQMDEPAAVVDAIKSVLATS